MADRPKRKAIPDKVKLLSVLRYDGKCPHCKERLGELAGLNFDHRPAIINRDVNDAGTDYVPAQLDPEYIEPTHIDCHKVRTFGLGGEKRVTTAGSDIHTRDKVDRLVEGREEFCRAVLAKSKPKRPGVGQQRTPGGLPRNKPQRSATTKSPKTKIAYRPKPPVTRRDQQL
jgi:hypothetical protein